MTLLSRILSPCAGSIVALSSTLALAQPAAGPLSPASPLIIDQQRQDRLSAPASPPPPALRAPAARIQATAQAAPATKLVRVKVIGSSLPAAALAAAWRSYVGRRLDARTIQDLANATSGAYARSDVALYTIVVPGQDMAGGVLTIQAVEGYLTNVVIGGKVKGPDVALVRRYATRLMAEKPLRRRSLQRYLSLARDLPGLKVDAQLRQAPQPGGVVLVLTLKQKRVQATLAMTNNGESQLGGEEAVGTLTLNGLAAPGDQLKLSAGASPSDVRLFQYYSAGYSAHLGSDGLTASASVSELLTRPRDTPISGQDTLIGMSLDYPLLRSYQQNLHLILGLDGQDSDNAAFGQNLYSDHTRALRGTVAWSRSTSERSLSATLTASVGLGIFDASANPLLTDTSFDKLNIQLGADQALGKEWVVRLRGVGQASRGLLAGAEQFALGGDQFGRAFPAAVVLGDYGAAGSGELAWRSRTLWPRQLAGSELYAFVDGGSATSRERLMGLAPQTTYDLASSGLGVRFAIAGKGVIGLEGAKAVVSPLPGQDPWRLLVSWSVQL